MHVLVLGGGGREHALAWRIRQSPLCARLTVAPGNGGTEAIAESAALEITSPQAVAAFCEAAEVDFVVVGPEAPLAAGVVDALEEAGVPAFGPSAAAARLEASKSFTKEICDACGAPTAAWARFDGPTAAAAHLDAVGAPIVVKADGLAAGKGVVVAESLEVAKAAAVAALSKPGAAVVIEEFMAGEEASLFVLTDGERVLSLGGAQDHKRAFDGDLGPNTGGMGAYAPAPVLTPAIEAQAMAEIIEPTLREMARRGSPYRGVLYAGLMISDGRARLVEFNARFGDPETQPLMLRLESDLLPALLACAAPAHRPAGMALDRITLDWSDDAALTVVMAAKGYPGAYAKGESIQGLDAAEAVEGVTVFHAGTRRENGAVTSNGGRVLNVTARGATLGAAQERAYAALDRISWPGGVARRDIGWRAL